MVDFGFREHPTEDNKFPTRTWGPEAWKNEYADAITKTHQARARIDWTVPGGHDMACSLFARTPMDYREATQKKKLLDQHDHNTGGVVWRKLWANQQDDTAPSTHCVFKFVHAPFLAVLGMPRTTVNGLVTCRQIQDYQLALHLHSRWVSL